MAKGVKQLYWSYLELSHARTRGDSEIRDDLLCSCLRLRLRKKQQVAARSYQGRRGLQTRTPHKRSWMHSKIKVPVPFAILFPFLPDITSVAVSMLDIVDDLCWVLVIGNILDL